MRYFNWGILGIVRQQSSIVIRELIRGNLSPFLRGSLINPKSDKGRNFNPANAFIYKVYLASLFDYLLRIDDLGLLHTINEPQIGNPFIIDYKGRQISQDLCSSIHEFYSIAKGAGTLKKAKIAELGAGYGRLAYLFLKANPRSSYCIIDIPPALYLSQEYLSVLFPNEKIFRFRPFQNYREVRDEFESSRIKFLMPHQIELLPDKIFDLTINISSLHEMTREQISNYLKQIERLNKGFFYSKQWQRSRTKDNSYIRQDEYPIPRKWKKVYHRPHPIQSMFFEALYFTGKNINKKKLRYRSSQKQVLKTNT